MTTPMLATQRLRRGRIRCRRCRSSRPVRISSCSRRSIASSRLEEPEPLQKLDPLTRGALFHEVQAEFFRALQARGTPAADATSGLPDALALLDRIVWPRSRPSTTNSSRRRSTRLARRDRRHRPRPARLGPAAAAARRLEPGVLRVQLRPAATRDATRAACPIRYCRRPFRLRGSVDLDRAVDADGAPLRVTDHKTGKNRTTWKTVIGGGAMLQPVLYSLAIEQALETAGHLRAGCSTAPRPAASPSTRSRSTRRTAAPASRRSRSSIARSSSASCRPRPAIARARGATSGRLRPGRRAARRGKSADKLGDLAGAAGRCHDAVASPTEHGARCHRHARSTTRWSSKRRRAPARRPSSSKRIVAHPREGRADVEQHRRGDLHREGRRRAEAAAARSARARRAARARTARPATRLDEALRVARGGARQHDPRLLRRSAARASGRGARRSAVRGADRTAVGAAVRRGVRRLAPGAAGRIRPKACAARCADRSGRVSAAARPGQADRSPAARRVGSRRSGATSPAPWTRPPFDRDSEIDALVESCTRSRR